MRGSWRDGEGEVLGPVDGCPEARMPQRKRGGLDNVRRGLRDALGRGIFEWHQARILRARALEVAGWMTW